MWQNLEHSGGRGLTIAPPDFYAIIFSYHLNLSRFLPDYISEIDFNAICKGGAHVDVLEKLLQENLIPLQRYVHFKIQNRQDAEDII